MKHNLNIFLASPSDLTEERKLVQEIVLELNESYAYINDFSYNLICWETKAVPSFGNEPQKIINQQLIESNDIDILIVLFWHRVGTQTSTHISGTIEEIEEIITKSKTNNHKTSVLIYFKNESPKKLSDINPKQLSELVEYKNKLQKNSLYCEFYNQTELQKFIRIHLIKETNDILKKK